MRRTAAATWLFIGMAAVSLVPGSAQAEPEPAEARNPVVRIPTPRNPVSLAAQTFLEGQRLFLDKQYEEALPLFEESYALQASPNSRLYIARCLVELGELYQAYEVYREVIVSVSDVESPNRYAETQMAASEERAALRLRLATVRITLSQQPPGLRLRLGERELAQSAPTTSYFADPGVLTLEATAPGYHDAVQRIDARGGEVTEVFVVLAHAAPPPKPLPPVTIVREVPVEHQGDEWAWVSAGVGAVGIVTWGVFGIQAERRYYRIQPLCDAGNCPLDQVERGRTETLISNIGLGVGLAGFAGAGVLWVWSRGDSPPSAPDGHRARPSHQGAVGVAVGLRPGYVSAEGQF